MQLCIRMAGAGTEWGQSPKGLVWLSLLSASAKLISVRDPVFLSLRGAGEVAMTLSWVTVNVATIDVMIECRCPRVGSWPVVACCEGEESITSV